MSDEALAPRRLGLIGHGAIARIVEAELPRVVGNRAVLVGVLKRSRDATTETLPVALNVEELLAMRPQLVAECAGHVAVAKYGSKLLRAGIDFFVVSTGALADESVERELREATAGGGRLILCSGAIGGIDALVAARLAGLHSVRYRSRKPPLAWLGTAAEQRVALAGLSAPTVFFRGSARDAARQYPKNANVAATVALAGLGFDRTEVELVADPTAAGNVHELEVSGVAGSFAIQLTGAASASNPKTSVLTAYSVLRAISNHLLPVVL